VAAVLMPFNMPKGYLFGLKIVAPLYLILINPCDLGLLYLEGVKATLPNYCRQSVRSDSILISCVFSKM
jgi:hypothetical protein